MYMHIEFYVFQRFMVLRFESSRYLPTCLYWNITLLTKLSQKKLAENYKSIEEKISKANESYTEIIEKSLPPSR